MKKFKEELARHVREKYQKLNKGSWVNATKSSTWIGSVDILKKIDDFIYVSRTSDRHNIGETISEEDAAPGGKWEQYTKEEYELRTAEVRASEFVSVSNRLRQELSATRYGDPMTLEDWSMPIPEFPPVFSSEDEDDYMDDDDGSVHCVVQSLVRDSELEGDINTSQGTSLAGENNDNMQGDSHENDALHSSSENGEADREGSELSSEDDDDHDEFISAAEEEQNERISKFFEDFPTCITKVEAVSVTSDKYSTAVMTQDPSWKWVGPARLTRRVREWLGEFARKYKPFIGCCEHISALVLRQLLMFNPSFSKPGLPNQPCSRRPEYELWSPLLATCQSKEGVCCQYSQPPNFVSQS